MFDVAEYLYGSKIDPYDVKKWIIKDSTMKAHYIDMMAMSWYVNWKMHEKEIIEKYGEVAPNPYEVFLVMYKRGAVQMRYSGSSISFEFYVYVSTLDTSRFETTIPLVDIYDEEALDEADRLFLKDSKNEIFL